MCKFHKKIIDIKNVVKLTLIFIAVYHRSHLNNSTVALFVNWFKLIYLSDIILFDF